MPLKVTKRASGIYRIRGTHYGVKVDRSANTRSSVEAEQIKGLWEKQIYEEQVLGIKPEDRKPTTFAEVAIDYMKANGEAKYLEPLIIKFGARPIKDLRQSDIDRFAAHEQFAHWANSTKNRQLLTPFIAIMNYGAHDDKCAPRKWKKLVEDEAQTEWITPDQAEMLLDDMKEASTRRLFVFHLCTGARAEEAALVKCRQFSPGGHRVTFLGNDSDDHVADYSGTKSGRTRSVDLPPRMMEYLPDLTRGNERAFLNRWGKPYAGRGALSKTLRAACKRVGISPIGPHALRHSFATWHYAVHKDTLKLMREGGWSDSKLVDRYVHAATDDLALAAIRGGWAIPGQSHKWFNEKPNLNKGVSNNGNHPW